jgi:hypothetical protein
MSFIGRAVLKEFAISRGVEQPLLPMMAAETEKSVPAKYAKDAEKEISL